ncbi:hypothetical protein [Algicella marina]|uniref:Uncharacterized protein n=1 Tax=Algicella marina TaxID=2683284 RepID=A0A6P1SX97_9RHOB|nr:hypothetical protein [Algicella marina]QHQ33963.1 hypothetical protein GO499_01580 [Algicella marina]
MTETDITDTSTARKSRVRERDFAIVVAISAAAFVLLVAFGWVLFRSGLLDYPDIAAGEVRAGMDAYFNEALAYRERRLTLALMLRTFLTGFSFIVGLALSTIGGVFILRQVTTLTTIAGGIGEPTVEDKRMQFSFAAYSPGVVFLVGGVAVMAFTQVLAINIRAVEVTAPGGILWCMAEDGSGYELCGEARSLATPSHQPADPEPFDVCVGPGGVNLCPNEEEEP